MRGHAGLARGRANPLAPGARLRYREARGRPGRPAPIVFQHEVTPQCGS